MIYVAAVIGFILGFFVGLVLLAALLRHVSKKELLSNAQIKWTYGLLNWGIAAAGAYIGVSIYKHFFLFS